MPFTLAHPVAVLPFARLLPLPALIAGSIAPDAVYYLPIPFDGSLTHSATGVFGPDVLVGLALLLAGRISVAPARGLFASRLSLPRQAISGGPVLLAGSIVLAVVLGAATHVAWDSCTQATGFAVRHWPLLRTRVHGPHLTYNILGYLSSVLGTATLGYVLFRRRHRQLPTLPATVRRPIRLALLVALVLGAGAAIDDPAARTSTYDLIRHTAVGGARAAAAAWLTYLVVWYCVLRHGLGLGLTEQCGPGSRFLSPGLDESLLRNRRERRVLHRLARLGCGHASKPRAALRIPPDDRWPAARRLR
ncbi:DUF4184 family protein [Nocardia rhizosphaerae]|uniref:DUF4184 family protein n=1 Tax=Nocardia rhizosphaerae TaxID=1691571 RepID=A0ABV8KY31_9NOCA